jgi:autotransporter-associated beta strand protein
MKPKYTFVRYRISRRFSVPGVIAIAVAMALTAKPVRAASGSWNVDAAGGWGTAGNWNPAAVPGTAVGDVINFTNNIGAARTITLDGARTLGDLNIGDSATGFFGFTLNTGSGGTLVMDVASGAASIDFLNAGTNGAVNTIGAGITLNDSTVIRSNNDKSQVLGGVINDGAASLSLTFNNDVNGTANAAASNQGQFTLSVANTYDGGTNISDVRVATGIAGGLGTGAVNVTGAGQAYLTGGTIANAFNLNTSGWVEGAGNLGALRIEAATLNGTVTMQRDTAIGVNSGTGTINGALNGVFNFTKSRGALLVLGGNNNMAGVTIVNDGQLRLNSAGALGNSPTVIVENPANPGGIDTNTLQLTGGFTLGAGRTVILRNNSTSNIPNARAALENTSGNNTWAGSILLNGGTNQTLQSAAGIFTISGNVTQAAVPSAQLFIRGNGAGVVTGNINIGTAPLFKTDVGTWTFSSSGHVYGALGIGNGTLVANATDAFNPALPITLGENNGNNTRLTINAGFTQGFSAISTFATTNGSQTIDGAGELNAGAGGTVVTVNEGTAVNDLTITANIIGAGGITKAGLGNLVLNNVTSGPVTVSAGTLTSTATLGGLSLASGTTLVPGTTTAAGTITTSTLALTDGTLAVNLGAAGSDVIHVTNSGGLTQSGTTTINVTPNGGFNPASTFYPVINYSGTSPGTSGFTVGTLPGRLAGSVFDNGSAIGITATNDRIIWTGAAVNGNWDVNTTTNWQKSSDSLGTNFLSQDDVIFNDGGIAQNSIALTGTINPVRVEFAQTTGNTYTLASGTLSGEGVMPLLVTGGGTVVLANANTYTGATTVTNNSTLQVDQSTGTLTGTSGVLVDAGSTLRLTQNNGNIAFNRNISGAGTVLVDANVSGVAGPREVALTGNNSGFSGTLDLDPSGTFATNGTFRTNAAVNQNNLGTANVIVRDGAQLWMGGTTIANSLTLTGAGYSEPSGGPVATAATGADGSTPSVPALAYSGIGAVRMENNGILSGNITLAGPAKIMPYNGTGTLSGTVTNTGATDDLVVGGGAAGTNLIITGDSSGLERIWVNGGGTAGTNTLIIGNNTTTGTLGSGDVILYQDAAIAAVRFQRTDGYTLGQNIISAHNGTATNMARGGVQINTTGTGLTLGSNTIDLSDGTNGGSINVGNTVNGSIFNIGTGASVETGFFGAGEAGNNSATVNQTGGAVAINGIAANANNNLRIGHWGTNTSTYNLFGGTLSFNAGAPATTPSAGGELGGGIYVGVDGQGIFNQSGGSVSTNWVVLDNRGNTGAGANMTTGIDQYNLSAGDLELKSIYGIIGRNTSTVVNLSGGTIRNTGVDTTDVAINSEISTAAATTTTLDTVNATRKFTLMNTITGTGTLTTLGGGLIELEPDSNGTRTGISTGTGTQSISAILDGTSAVTKLGSGTTTLSAANTYSGATTISAGRLNLPGSLANSALTANNTTVLGGEGSAASLTFGTAGTDTATLVIDGVSPGALTTPGALTVNGTVNVDFSVLPTATTGIVVLNHGSTTATSANFALANAANFRPATFTVNATDVTMDLGKAALVWDGSTATWEIGGAENDWNGVTPENFFNNDDVTFDDSLVAANQTITMAAGLQPGSITVNNSTYSYALTGGGIAGSTGITKTGSLGLDLGGTNSYTGAVSVNNGTLRITTNTALGSTAGGTTVSGTGTLDIGGIGTINALNIQGEAVTISGAGVGGAGAIINSSALDQTNAFGLVTLAGNASIGGTSRWDIRGANSLLNLAGNKLTKVGSNLVYATVDGTISSGDVEVDSGTFAIWNGTVLGAGDIKVNPGAVLELSNMVAGKFDRQITLNGGSVTSASANGATSGGNVIYTAASTINNAQNLTLSGAITETGGSYDLVKTGGGTLILTGTNGLTGKVNVTAGILRVPTDALLGPATGADAITLQGGGRLQAGTATAGVDLTLSSSKGITLPAGDGGFHVWTGFTLSYAGDITGAGSLTKTDGGTLVYSGTASHTGATTINGGAATLNGATVSGTNILQVGTATLNIGAGSAITTPTFVTSQGSNTSSTINQSGGSLTITGTNSTNSNAASFLFGHWGGGNTSVYNLSGGVLDSVGAELSLGWDSSNAVFNQSGGTANLLGLDLGNGRSNPAAYNLNGGTLNLGANGITTNGSKAVNIGGGTLGAFANWTTGQAIVLTANGGNVTVNTLDSVDNTTARNITTTGALSGPGGLVKTGAGTLLFNGAAQYTGTTTVNDGRLAVDGNQPGNRLSNNHQVTVNNGGTFQINGVNALPQGANAVDFTLNSGGILNVMTGFSAQSPAAGSHAHIRNLTLNGGTVDFSYSGSGTAYSTESFLLGGQITVGGTTVSTIQSSTAEALSGLAIQGTRTFSVADATGSSATDLLVTAEIEDGDSTGGVTKTGAGTLEVTAANSYTNGTIVNVGKLLVNNTSGSGTGTNTVTVAAGAFLGGTGTIAGATTVNGTLEPGSNAVGTLNASSTVSLAVGSTYAVEITGAGTNDKVAATGALTANGTIAVTLDGYVPVLGNTFDIADASGFSGTPTFNFAAAPLTLGLVWDTSQFLTNGTISVVSADPYNAWAADNGIVEGKFGDDDDDGVANLIEFATNSDAADGSSGARVYPKMHLLGGDNVLTYTVAVRKNATFAAGVPDASKQQATKDQILYTIEASNDLTTWNAVTVTKLNPGDSTAVQAAITPALPVLDADWEWHTFRTDGGASVDVSDYIRLNVLVAP